MVKDEDNDHANLVLLASEPSGGDKNADGDGDSDNGKCELRVMLVCNNNDQLNDETKEEEEIKLEKRNVDLILWISIDKFSEFRGYAPDSEGNASSSCSRPR